MIDAEAIFAAAAAAEKARAEQMPTEKDAIRAMHQAWLRLKELGWREGLYMPLTADRFAGIQCGSTGIHAYSGTRDEGPFSPPMYTIYDGDIWPTRVPPALFRPWRDTDVQMELRPTYLGLVNEPSVSGVAAPVRTWQHDETGRITQTAECPGPRWIEVPAGVAIPDGGQR